MSDLRTEYPFVLPKGYLDVDGQVHREGTMRLATAADELEPLEDGSVRGPDDPALPVVVLSRVITRLGSAGRPSPADLRRLFAADLAHLREVYRVVNYGSPAEVETLLDGSHLVVASARDAQTSVTADDAPPADAGGVTATAATPVTDAARAMLGQAMARTTPSPWLQVVPEESGPVEEPVVPEPPRPRRRGQIEEVGRSSRVPGSR